MIKNTVLAVIFILAMASLAILGSCVPVPSGADPEVVKAVWTADARHTREARQVREEQDAAATQQAGDATATSVQSTAGAATATAYSATEAATTLEARQTMQSWSLTVTAVTGIQQVTQQAADRQATADSAAVIAQITAVAAQAENAQLALERARLVNTIYAYAPIVVSALLIGLLAWLIVRGAKTEFRRRQWIPKDPRGDSQLFDDGQGTIIDPDRMPGAIVITHPAGPLLRAGRALGLLPAGQPPRAAVVDPSVTARDQLTDMTSRGLPGQSARAQLPGGFMPQYNIYGMQDTPAQLDDDTAKILDAEWKESTDGE